MVESYIIMARSLMLDAIPDLWRQLVAKELIFVAPHGLGHKPTLGSRAQTRMVEHAASMNLILVMTTGNFGFLKSLYFLKEFH